MHQVFGKILTPLKHEVRSAASVRWLREDLQIIFFRTETFSLLSLCWSPIGWKQFEGW